MEKGRLFAAYRLETELSDHGIWYFESIGTTEMFRDELS